MNPLNIQNTAQGTVVTYKLNPGDQLDRMTMGMLRNNHIQGILPIQYSQVDENRWIKYEVHTMIPLHAYLSGGLNRKKALSLFEQVIETFILAEDYMIDAAFIILNPKHVFVDAFTGAIGIVCLPVTGFVSDVTLRDFLLTITGHTRFNQEENCDYVMKIRNFVNGTGFSVLQLRKLIKELAEESVQRSYRERLSDETAAAEETGGQTAVAVGSVAQMMNQGAAAAGHTNETGFAYSGGRGEMQENGEGREPKGCVSGSGEKGKRDKEKKGLFGRKKKKKEKRSSDDSMSVSGMEIPGMEIPGMDSGKRPVASEEPAAIQTDVSAGFAAVPNPTKELPASDSLAGLSELIAGKNLAGHAGDMPEWKVSPDYDSVAISDSTVFLNINKKETAAVLKRVRTGETVTLEKEQVVLGKDTSRVDFCISGNSTVSRVHARIVRRDNQYFVIDDNSMNHTYVNDMQIAAGQEFPLQSGCRIKLSDEEFQFVNGEEI